jgi:hypothetical protein
MDAESDRMAELTGVERSLVDHVVRGDVLDLVQDEEVDKAAMRSSDASRTVRASVIRDIARGRLAADPDPHGLRLRGARITGRLDLDNVTSTVPLKFTDCLLDEGLVARDAHLVTLELTRCRLEHPTEPPASLERLITARLGLKEAVIIGHRDQSAMRLLGAHIGGDLALTVRYRRGFLKRCCVGDGGFLGPPVSPCMGEH